MELGRVVGQVVATQKDEKLKGRKLLVVELLDEHLKPQGSHVVAVDSVSAGQSEVVIIVRGSSARQTTGLEKVPTDTSIIAIVDALEIGKKTVFEKAKA